jgi:ABC-type lipoprotein export system ATPase subunit
LNAHVLSFFVQGGKALQLLPPDPNATQLSVVRIPTSFEGDKALASLPKKPDLTQLSAGSILTAFEHTLISVEHISRVVESHARKTTILDDISFTIPRQSLFSINGPSGSGKSTLLNILTGIDRPTSGRVLFGDIELRAKSEDALARWRGHNVGIVFQFFQLIPTLTALENVLLALELGGGSNIPRRQWRDRAQECLEIATVGHLADRLPSEISGGEQQRVAIARALVNNPPVLVADEPTGNLDSRSAGIVFETLAGLTEQGKTVIYVTHDPQLAVRATARVELLDGHIIECQGTTALISRS